ncbi:MAG: hypothetical protein EOM26_12315 [Alphaproteobacteria bacterium]|nr:hypothetical protein [Alphaproteobacteria bacterium]
MTQPVRRIRFPPLTSLLILSLALAFAARVFIVFYYELNWDEFSFLNFVYEHSRGDLRPVLQTIQVHAFKWLSLVSQNEVDQIVAARLIMLVFQIVTGVLVFRIARQFAGVNAALFAALAYFSFSYVIWQGTSFRYDGIAACFLSAAIFLLIRRPDSLVGTLTAAVLVGFSGLLTMKSVFFVPTLGLILLANLFTPGTARRRFALSLVFGLTAGATVLLFYHLHAGTFPPSAVEESSRVLTGSTQKSISLNPLFPGRGYLLVALYSNFAYWIFVFAGIAIAVRKLAAGAERAEGLTLVALALPLLSLAVYRNTFPYYYVFLLPTVSVLGALAWQTFEKRGPGSREFLLGGACVILTVNIVAHGFARPLHKPLTSQRELLAVIHKTFPEPVPYIDRCGMVSSFPWAGFFMSVWGLENYRYVAAPDPESRTGEAIPEMLGPARPFAEIVETERPKFIVANIAQLDIAQVVYPPDDAATRLPLYERDVQALTENYLPWWGSLYLAGKELALSGDAPAAFTIIVEGPYTLVARHPVQIDGSTLNPGDSVELAPGRHVVEGSGTRETIKLFWGNRSTPPKTEPPDRPMFNFF